MAEQKTKSQQEAQEELDKQKPSQAEGEEDKADKELAKKK